MVPHTPRADEGPALHWVRRFASAHAVAPCGEAPPQVPDGPARMRDRHTELTPFGGQGMNENALNLAKWIRFGLLGLAAVIVLLIVWPFYSVPTGSRGVVTQFGRIIGIENEGLAILP